MIEYDKIEIWHPNLSRALEPFISNRILNELISRQPEFVEDACDILLLDNRDEIIDATIHWLYSNSIAGFHGTRISEEDEISIKAHGLRPLSAPQRQARLNRVISSHINQHQLKEKIDDILHKPENLRRFGERQGQVHLTLSLGGLSYGFNHYLEYGSEFDYHVIQSLLGKDGLELLRRDGESKVVTVNIPGRNALDAAHPYLTLTDLRSKGEVPNVVGEFLKAYAFRLVRKSYQPENSRLDCGLVFRDAVSPEWIHSIVKFDETCFRD